MNSLPHISGIYKITCLPTGKFYIGSSVDVHQRWNEHCSELRRGVHNNSYLQRAWRKYGENGFVVEIVEVCEKSVTIEREQFWLDTLQPYGDCGFNLASNAQVSALGRIMSEGQRKQISLANKGRRHTDQFRKQVSERLKGNQHTLGYKHTQEAKDKMSRARKGRKVSAETIEKFGATQKKSYIVTSPNGEEIMINGLGKFCRENNLDTSTMSAVARGKHQHHKGWKCRYAEDKT